MPIYIFKCSDKDCNHEQEIMLTVAELDEAQWCEKCGGQCQQTPAPVGKFIRGKGGWSSPA